MDKTKTTETSLVLTTGFLVLFLIFGKTWMIYTALAFGLTGLFVKPLARQIATGWFKLAEILNFFVSKIILGMLFFVVLWPVSQLYKISNKNKLRLKRSEKSMWIERNHIFSAGDLKNIW